MIIAAEPFCAMRQISSSPSGHSYLCLSPSSFTTPPFHPPPSISRLDIPHICLSHFPDRLRARDRPYDGAVMHGEMLEGCSIRSGAFVH